MFYNMFYLSASIFDGGVFGFLCYFLCPLKESSTHERMNVPPALGGYLNQSFVCHAIIFFITNYKAIQQGYIEVLQSGF